MSHETKHFRIKNLMRIEFDYKKYVDVGELKDITYVQHPHPPKKKTHTHRNKQRGSTGCLKLMPRDYF